MNDLLIYWCCHLHEFVMETNRNEKQLNLSGFSMSEYIKYLSYLYPYNYVHLEFSPWFVTNPVNFPCREKLENTVIATIIAIVLMDYFHMRSNVPYNWDQAYSQNSGRRRPFTIFLTFLVCEFVPPCLFTKLGHFHSTRYTIKLVKMSNLW